MKISIIIPVYNEKKTLRRLLKKIREADMGGLKKEIIIVDDFSTDGTREILKKIKDKKIKIVYQTKNYGKGFAIRTGFESSTGEIILIQDADLEYDPKDYLKLIKPILLKKEEVVYGSRFLRKNQKVKFNSFYFGNKILSFITSLFYFKRITDMETCYKVFKKEVIKNIKLNSRRFEFEPEITSKILKRGIHILEVPISYYPRSKKEGKKIGWRDGVMAIRTLIRYKFFE